MIFIQTEHDKNRPINLYTIYVTRKLHIHTTLIIHAHDSQLHACDLHVTPFWGNLLHFMDCSCGKTTSVITSEFFRWSSWLDWPIPKYDSRYLVTHQRLSTRNTIGATSRAGFDHLSRTPQLNLFFQYQWGKCCFAVGLLISLFWYKIFPYDSKLLFFSFCFGRGYYVFPFDFKLNSFYSF